MATAALSWTPAGGPTSLSQDIQYKPVSSSSWTTFANVSSSTSSANVTGLTDNVIYDFRIVNNCSWGGPIPSPTIQRVKLTCPTVSTTPSYDQITVSFSHLGGSVDRYIIELLAANGTTLLSSIEVTNPSGSVSEIFEDLEQSTNYNVRVTVYAASFSKTCSTIAVSTIAAPSCDAPTDVIATLS